MAGVVVAGVVVAGGGLPGQGVGAGQPHPAHTTPITAKDERYLLVNTTLHLIELCGTESAVNKSRPIILKVTYLKSYGEVGGWRLPVAVRIIRLLV